MTRPPKIIGMPTLYKVTCNGQPWRSALRSFVEAATAIREFVTAGKHTGIPRTEFVVYSDYGEVARATVRGDADWDDTVRIVASLEAKTP